MCIDRIWRTALTAGVVLVAAEAVLLLWPDTASGANGWLRRIHIDVAGESVVAQTFAPQVDGLAGLKVFARPSSAGLQESIRLQLSEVVDEHDVPIDAREVPIAQLGDDGALLYRFPQIDDSAQRRYKLSISVPGSHDGHGVSLEIIKGDTYGGGELSYNDTPRWADLRFDVVAHPRAYTSKFLAHSTRRQSSAALLILAAVSWLGVHVLALGAVLILAGRATSPADEDTGA